MKKKSLMKSKKFVIYVKKNLVLMKSCKVRDHCHYTGKYWGAAQNNCNLKYKIPKEIPIVFHNGCIYDDHFIMKQLTIEFKGKFDFLRENTEKYITVSAQIYKKW